MKKTLICLLITLSTIALADDSAVLELSQRSYSKMQRTEPLFMDEAANEYVRCVVDEIVAVIHPNYKKQEWEVTLFDNDRPVAFALPGGRIGINTGLLNQLSSQDELASVLAQQVAHVTTKHANKRVAEHIEKNGRINYVGATMNKNLPFTAAVLGAYEYYEVDLPFTTAEQNESEIIALQYLAKAGYNPQASLRVAEKLGTPQVDLKQMKAMLPTATKWYKTAQANGKQPSCQL